MADILRTKKNTPLSSRKNNIVIVIEDVELPELNLEAAQINSENSISKTATTADYVRYDGNDENNNTSNNTNNNKNHNNNKNNKNKNNTINNKEAQIIDKKIINNTNKDNNEMNAAGDRNDCSDEDDGNKIITDSVEINRRKMYKKRKYVLDELLETEKKYIDDLGQIVEGYMVLMKTSNIEKPDSLDSMKENIVFGNVHQIYEWHKNTFQPELEKCINDPQNLASLFIKYEKRFLMYVKYCENKPKSEDIVYENLDYFEQLREVLEQKLQLADMLIKPVQRIMKYQLLFKDILKYTDKAGDDLKCIQKALEVMCIIPKAANDMMNVGRLQGFKGKVTAQGRLLLQDTLEVAEVSPSSSSSSTSLLSMKFQERRAFLFEQIIIFSEQPNKKNNNNSNNNGPSLTRPSYIYKNSINVNRMLLEAVHKNSELMFKLIDKTPGSSLTFICKASDEKIKKNWTTQIKLLLDMQMDMLKALQAPIAYQNELAKSNSSSDLKALAEEVQNANKKNSSKNVKGSKSSRSFKNFFSKNNNSQNVQLQIPKLKIVNNFSDPGGNSQNLQNSTPCLEDKQNNGSETVRAKWSLFSNLSKHRASTPVIQTFNNNSSNDQTLKQLFLQPNSSPPSFNCQIEENRASFYTSLENIKISRKEKNHHTVPVKSKDKKSKTKKNKKRSIGDNSLESNDTKSSNIDDSTLSQNSSIIQPPKTAGILSGWATLKHLMKRPSMSIVENKKMASKKLESDIEEILFRQKTPPKFTKLLEDATVTEGSTAIFKCRIEHRYNQNRINDNNDPNTEYINLPDKNLAISWLNNNNEVLDGSKDENVVLSQTLVDEDSERSGDDGGDDDDNDITENCETFKKALELTLKLNNAKPCQSGTYTCHVTNEGGGASVMATLKVTPGVKPKPKLRSKPNDQFLQCVDELSKKQTRNKSFVDGSFEFLDKFDDENRDAETLKWQTNFDSKFSKEKEIHKGKCSTVFTCTRSCVGNFDTKSEKSAIRKNNTQTNIENLTLTAKLYSKFFKTKDQVYSEGNMSFKLNQENIVSCLELFESPTHYILVQPKITHGQLLEYLCFTLKSFNQSQVLNFSLQLFASLSYMHSKNIVHLNIKPENLLVDVTDSLKPILKVIDFSSAHQFPSTSSLPTHVQHFQGDPEFSPPEVLKHIPVNYSSDVWNAGIMMYCMCCGSTPFYDANMEICCQKIVDLNYNFPEKSFSELNEGIIKVISSILIMPTSKRPTADTCQEKCKVLMSNLNSCKTMIDKTNLIDFISRRKATVL